MNKTRLIDLSHTIENGLITYKGLPAPIICDHLSREASKDYYADGTTFQIGKIEMVANTGTYIDSPFHRYEDGKDLSELPLESLADLDAVVFRVAPNTRVIDADVEPHVGFIAAGSAARGDSALVIANSGDAFGRQRVSE